MVQSHEFYKLYQDVYLKYTELYGSKVCVFLRKGSFFEFYGQQDPLTLKQLNTAKQVIDLFGIVLHVYPEDGPNGTTGLFGGVPEYTLDKWASKLTRIGWTVVVLDEVKNGAGKVSKREVRRVLSAGTHIEVAELNTSCFLATLWLEFNTNQPPSFGVASADLTTGQTYLYEGSATGKTDTWHTDDLRHFFQVYPPKELVILVRNGSAQLIQESLRPMLHVPTAPIHIRLANSKEQGSFEQALVREDYMRSMFDPSTALPLRTWLRVSPLSERALVGLLRFAEDHAPKLASCLQAPSIWHPKQNLQIINNALTQLNLIGNSDQTCVEDIFSTPHTPMGKRSLRVRLCTPLAGSQAILDRQEQVGYLLGLDSRTKKTLEGFLGLLYDVSRLHRAIVRGSLTAIDVIQLNQSYQTSLQLIDILDNSSFFVKGLKEHIQLCLTSLLSFFDIEKALKGQSAPGEIGFLLDLVGPQTALAEFKIQEIYKTANDWIEKLRSDCKIDKEALYFKPTEKDMFSIHATKSALKQVETAVKAHTLKEVYAKLSCKILTSSGRIDHPFLDQIQEGLDLAKLVLGRCLAKELPEACIQYSVQTREFWLPMEEWLTNLDLSLSMANTALKQGWNKPTIKSVADSDSDSDSSSLQIEGLRHPLIETQMTQSKYVTHSVSLDNQNQGWLLYGMNASGKSSLMKAIGLAVLLAQIGSYVPAKTMSLRPFARIATRILNQDNLWAGLSSFAVEMSELREVLAVADNQTLVLGDELCSGTESISGTAIVAAGIQHLHKAGARFVLATHLHDLMKIQQVIELPGLCVWHLHVEYDPVRDLLIYHRSLRTGSGSSIYGLEVAKALHLPLDMIESAFQFRRQLLGESAPEEAKSSSWNTAIVRRICSACQKALSSELEVHHLQERAHADGHGRNQDGLALNHVRNLAVLCQSCHDKVHAGLIQLGPIEDTSQGPKRQVLDLSEFACKNTNSNTITKLKTITKTKTQFVKEDIEKIQQTVKENPGLHARLLVFQLQKQGLIITEAQLKTLQKNGLV